MLIGALAALLGIAVVAVTFNTIRLQVLTRRDEIEIASLVGATPAWLRRPFLYFGMLQGAAAGMVATGAGAALLWVANARLGDTLASFGAGAPIGMITCSQRSLSFWRPHFLAGSAPGSPPAALFGVRSNLGERRVLGSRAGADTMSLQLMPASGRSAIGRTAEPGRSPGRWDGAEPRVHARRRHPGASVDRPNSVARTFHRRKVAPAYPTKSLGNFCRPLALSMPEC